MQQDSESNIASDEFSQQAPPSASASASSSAPACNSGDNNGTEQESLLAKRRSIKKLMNDQSLSEKDRRLSIQALMNGSTASSYSNQCSFGSTVTASTSRSSITSMDLGQNSIAASEEEIMSCVHYEAKCNIVAPCCNRVFGCRVCHDEMTPEGHPAMDRFKVREVVCKECHTRQERSNQCIKCKIIFAEYHCNLCNIWMDLTKEPFHCDKCGICRVGGHQNFRHCDECCMCIAIALYDTHSCLKDKYKNSCPVCREDMHTSRLAAQDLPCGHAIHSHCLRNLASFDYRCPICKKSVMDHEMMHDSWERRAQDIAMQPMPDDLKRKVTILCNDCEMRSEDQDWHFLGARCPGCASFNTVVDTASAATNR